VITIELRIKNQLPGTVDLCIGEQELQLEPEQDVIVPVEDGDCLYLVQIVPKKPISPEEQALVGIVKAIEGYKAGNITRAEATTLIKMTAYRYFETSPIPFEVTDKAGGPDD